MKMHNGSTWVHCLIVLSGCIISSNSFHIYSRFYDHGSISKLSSTSTPRSTFPFQRCISSTATNLISSLNCLASDDDENSTINPSNNEQQTNSEPDSISRRRILLSMLVSTGVTSTSLLSNKFPAFASSTIPDTILPEASVVVQAEAVPSIAKSLRGDGNTKLIIPPMDNRKYETMTLENGLRVLLCSDPSSNTAAAAMDVHVGAASDPDSVPGLAHFCEHMLFLGTKKYPQEDSFESFLSANGGSSNAFTDSEDTVYFFDMTADKDQRLAEGLDRFGSFFTSPLFTESATGRELNAIESENAKNLQSDTFRLFQMDKSRANTKHPYSKFYTGNKSTLLDMTKKQGIDLRTELIKFWGTYYSAKQMSLAIVAPQSISTLKTMVNNAFGAIPNNPDQSQFKPEEAWVGKIPPFAEGSSIIPAQKSIVEIVPVADMRQVTLTWPIVYQSLEDKEDQFINKPAFYITHLLGHEGPNSLLSYLKKKGWANGVSASTEEDLSDFYTLEVSVQLTNKGLKAVIDVVEAVFSYIQMIRDQPIPKFTFDEVLQLSELEWRFATKGAPTGYVQGLVKGMQQYPESLYIAGPRRLALRDSQSKLLASSDPRSGFAFDKQLDETIQSTSNIAAKLTVDNALVTVTSKSFGGTANQSEKWYGTKYSVKPLSAVQYNMWKNCPNAFVLGMTYPQPNLFIPSEKGLRVKKPVKKLDEVGTLTFEERMKPITPPELIRDDGDEGRWKVYFKQDDRFGLPKAIAIFRLLNREVYDTPINAILSKLYQVALSDRLKEYTYDASLTGLSFDVQVTPRGLRLLFGGYNDKLLDFAQYVSTKVSQDITQVLPENEDEFERYKDEIVRALAAFDVQQVYSHAIYYSNLALNPRNFLYTNSELRDAIEKVNLSDLTMYVASLWKSGKGEALVQGNIEKQESLKFVDVIDNILNFKTISKDEIPEQYEALKLPCTNEPTKITVSEPNPNNKNAASQISFECIDPSEKAHVVVEIISAILSERFYEDLRTRQQLGYVVSCGVKSIAEARSLAFVVQSSVKPAEQLTAAIIKFIDEARKTYLEPLTDNDIDIYTKGLLLKRTEPDKQLASEVTRNWNEIATGRLQFDRRQAESKALLEVTKEDIINYWDEIILGKSKGRRMLITEVIPKSGPASSKSPPKTYLGPNQLGINDIDEFREQLKRKP